MVLSQWSAVASPGLDVLNSGSLWISGSLALRWLCGTTVSIPPLNKLGQNQTRNIPVLNAVSLNNRFSRELYKTVFFLLPHLDIIRNWFIL